jgi:adenosylcobinamide-GDP ribazoletransferase
MRIIKSFFIAFSMYSKIPMPQFEWKDEDMRYALCFFPWVGAVIGVLWYLWKWICVRFGVGTLCYTVVGTAIPILITGGFHVDGFLDTCFPGIVSTALSVAHVILLSDASLSVPSRTGTSCLSSR